MKKKWLAPLLIYIALIITCLIVIYAIPSVKGLLEKTYITEYGEIDIADDVEAYIVRDETVYVAAGDSRIKRNEPEFALVKASRHILELTPVGSGESEDSAASGDAGEDEGSGRVGHKYSSALERLGDNVRETEKGYNKWSGYICYYIDGVEEALSTSHLSDLRESDFRSLTRYRSIATPESRCSKGEPLFKIITNKKWYFVFYTDNDTAAKYGLGRSLTVKAGEEDLPAKVAGIEEEGKKTRITLVCKAFNQDLFRERKIKTTVTLAKAEGLILNDSSIIEVKGRKGVLIRNKLGEHRFRPISIKADNGEQCVVYSDLYVDEEGNFVETIGTYDEIIAEPSEEEVKLLNEEQ